MEISVPCATATAAQQVFKNIFSDIIADNKKSNNMSSKNVGLHCLMTAC